MLIALKKVILDPPLYGVERHWDYNHHCYQLCLGISIKGTKYFLSKQKQRSAVDDFKKEHDDLAQQYDQTPNEHLQPPNSIVDVLVGVVILPQIVQ